MNTEPRTPYPKIELHVHLEATIQPKTLLAIAKRNGETLPADTVEGLRELYRFRDFDHFIEVWILTTNCLRTEEDFRQVVVDYAAEAKRHGAVYLEAIFSPIERTWRGISWDAIFEGYCSGVLTAEPRGSGGFGYDPIFVPDDDHSDRTMAELAPIEKDAISHRGRASRELLAWLASR